MLCLITASAALSAPVLADSVCKINTTDRPKIGLVLGGGGARGAAHIGVIQALHEMRVPVDYIAGTSMGALIGGLHATGMTPDELRDLMEDIDWADMFSDNVPREDRPWRRKTDDDLGLYGAKLGLSKDGALLPPGAVAGQKVLFLLESLIAQREQTDDFDYLPIPFRAVAVDIVAAEAVVIDSGRLSRAMRSSMALPAVFDPVDDGDRLLVDGGVLMNVPVSVGKEMGADIIIAVDVGSPLALKENVDNLLKVLFQLTGVVTVENTRQQLALLGEDDFIVKPPISDEISTGSFARAAEAIPAGYTETMKFRTKLETLSISQSDWDRRLTRIAGCVDGAPTIEFLRVNNQSRYSDEVINKRLNVDIGHVLDIRALEVQLSDIYSLGFLQNVSYQIIHEDDRIGVQVDVLPDTRGTSFFEYGVGLNSTDFMSSFNLRLGYLRTHIDGYGGEFRALVQLGQDFGVMTELYKPLGPGLRWIFHPRIAAEKSDLNVYDDNGNRLYQVAVQEAIIDAGLERLFGNNGMIKAGVRVGGGDVEMNIGDPNFDAFDFSRGEVYVAANYDTQDNRFFPGSGSSAYLAIGQSRKSLGADEDFEQVRANWIKAWTHGRHSYLASAEIGLSSDDAIPVQSLFRLGGFPRMSGYDYNELLGENIYLGIAGYRYKMLEGSILPGYLGATFEVGNASSSYDQLFDEQIYSGSLYFGIDSLIGPMYIGVGMAEGGRYLPFLTIGSIFSRNSLTRRY